MLVVQTSAARRVFGKVSTTSSIFVVCTINISTITPLLSHPPRFGESRFGNSSQGLYYLFILLLLNSINSVLIYQLSILSGVINSSVLIRYVAPSSQWLKSSPSLRNSLADQMRLYLCRSTRRGWRSGCNW